MNCDSSLRMRLADALSQHPVESVDRDGLTRAAVALLVIDEGYGADVEGMPRQPHWSQEAALLLTRRSARLNNHPGQWALPGGRVDPGETAEQTALREIAEEVGVQLAPDHVLGRLDDFVTRSQFLITPIVIWGGQGLEFTADANEVESLHRIPVREFLRADAPQLEIIPESDRPVLRMPVGSTWIAAPTAAIIFQFREVCVFGRDTRVAHYEQPVFAWK